MILSADLKEVQKILLSHRFNYTYEKELQSGLDKVFLSRDLIFEREFDFKDETGIIDFLFESGLGIEVKCDGSRNALVRQVHRYCAKPEVRELMVVVDKARLTNMPTELNGKKIHVHRVAGNAF